MALDERKKNILNHIREYYGTETSFCAKDVTLSYGETVAPATLAALGKAGHIQKIAGSSPVCYVFKCLNPEEAMLNMEGLYTDISVIQSWDKWQDVSDEIKAQFPHIGTISINQSEEAMIWNPDNEIYDTRAGLVYIFVVNGFIYKDGKTDTTMRERISSYNCGKKSNRIAGTCSVTNFKVLQTLLSFNTDIEVYAYFVNPIQVQCFGETITTVNSPAKTIEKKLNEKLMLQFGRLMPGCYQS